MLKEISNKYKVNKIVWFLTLSDIFTWGVYTIISGFIGLYISKKIGSNVEVVLGIGIGLFYLAKGMFQIPIGIITDKIKKDKDDILFLLIGNLMMGLPYLYFPSITTPFEYYVLQFVIGTGAAMNLVNWRKIFAKNLTIGKEGLEYGFYDTIMSFSMIFLSILAGIVSNLSDSHFDLVVLIVGIFMISSTFWVFLLYKEPRKQ